MGRRISALLLFLGKEEPVESPKQSMGRFLRESGTNELPNKAVLAGCHVILSTKIVLLQPRILLRVFTY